MQLKIDSHQLKIVPENPQDVAWLEHVLNLRNNGDTAVLKRVNIHENVIDYSFIYVIGKKSDNVNMWLEEKTK